MSTHEDRITHDLSLPNSFYIMIVLLGSMAFLYFVFYASAVFYKSQVANELDAKQVVGISDSLQTQRDYENRFFNLGQQRSYQIKDAIYETIKDYQ